MNDIKQTLLGLLAGHDSKTPVALADLVEQSGIDINALSDALHSLYSSGQVNCALITRGGVSYLYYWPTGIVRPVPLRDYKITNTPRRTDQPTQPAAKTPEKDEPPMQDTAPTETAVPSKTQRIIAHLLKHRTAFGSDLCKIADTTSPGAFLKSYINRGLVTVSEGTDRKNGRTYTLREGVTIDDIEKVRQANPAHRQAEAQSKPDQENVADIVPRFAVVPPIEKTSPRISDALNAIQEALGKGLILRISEFGMAVEDLHRNTYEITADDADQTIQAIHLLNSKRAA